MKKKKLGINIDDIVCIYTGRFTEDKNPLCLAKAINDLINHNEPYKALFIGDGPQKEKILALNGCIVLPFKPLNELPKFYNIADIGVWPNQESTSMLDAMACGLPIVISNKVKDFDRVDGNGLTYIQNDHADLYNKLLLLKSKKLRHQFGILGEAKVLEKYSWKIIANNLYEDYKYSCKQ